MNKRCTNSSCRKTFSTLSYGGQCPFCGKVYPQLTSSRKDGTLPPPVRQDPVSRLSAPMRFVIRRAGHKRKDSFRLWLNLDDLRKAWQDGQKLAAIKAFRNMMFSHGFQPGLRDSKQFCEALGENSRPCAFWKLTGEEDPTRHLPIIEPVFTNETGARKGNPQPRQAAAQNVPIEDLDLSVRGYNCLKRAGIHTVQDIQRLDPEEMAQIRNLGARSRAEIAAKLQARGIALPTAGA